MRFYTCCPEGACGTFQADLNLLHSWGIEPAVCEDDDGHFLEFDLRSAGAPVRCRPSEGHFISRSHS